MSQPTAGALHVDSYPSDRKAKKKAKKKRMRKAGYENVVPIWKDDSLRIVYGVALAPDQEDSQGDVVSAQEIEKAAHAFLVAKRQTDVQHKEEQVPVDVIESYIAPQDLVVAGQPVRKGSWVMAHKVHDDGIWEQVVKGELTGLSIGGSAIRLAEETA